MDLVVLPPWIPEDDLLLKNAVEAGASLESLAKGAVRFSRKYSVAELRDRWRSLLYDPDVSVEASASMANLELSGKSSGSGVKDGSGEGAVAKRKGPSIRKQYYAMRKRLCRQVFDSFQMALHDEMCVNKDARTESGTIDGLNRTMNHFIANNLVDYGTFSGLENVGPSRSVSDVLLWKSIEDVSASAMLVEMSPENKDHDREGTRATLPHGLKVRFSGDLLNAAAAAVAGEDERRLSDSLLNLNEDELLFTDVDRKDTADKPSDENVNSLLLSSPCKTQGNNGSDICACHKLGTETKAAVPSSSTAAGREVVANSLDCSHSDVPSESDPGSNVQSSALAKTLDAEPNEDCKFCMLNAEDSDVPCEDSTDSSIVVPGSTTLKSQSIVKEGGCTDSSVNNQRKKEPDRSLKKVDNPSHSSASSQPQIVIPGSVSNINSSQPPVGVVMKAENPERNPISAVSRQSNNVNINRSNSRLAHATIMPAIDGRLKQKEIDAPIPAKVHAHSRAEQHKDLLELGVKSLSLNQKRDSDDDDDNDDDNDNDGDEVPSFSDAEAMILEMDLYPTDKDMNASREVLRYHHAETKRTIMRLEQCGRSFMQRAIACQGAFAVLYGRNLKQYINKREVILGRGTDDVQVDIDLRREGCANKISRRQALIKMEANGSFIIKNLGKSSIFLNGKEVATGQLRGLNGSSLIEIRGMSFIFETNNKSVRGFLENMDNKGEDKAKAFAMVA